MVHTHSSNGILEGAGLVLKAGTASGNYHGQINAKNFDKWLNEIVIPKLPPAPTLVTDNVPVMGNK
jgi:hypothetical protein